jgi:hypothetical protein
MWNCLGVQNTLLWCSEYPPALHHTERGDQVIEDFKQVMDEFRVYLQLLVEKMPKTMAFDDLKAFINDRDWPDRSWGLGRCKELLEQ